MQVPDAFPSSLMDRTQRLRSRTLMSNPLRILEAQDAIRCHETFVQQSQLIHQTTMWGRTRYSVIYTSMSSNNFLPLTYLLTRSHAQCTNTFSIPINTPSPRSIIPYYWVFVPHPPRNANQTFSLVWRKIEAKKQNARGALISIMPQENSGIDVANGSLSGGRLQESSEENTSEAKAEHGLEDASVGRASAGAAGGS